MADIFEITGRIHSTSQEHVVAPASEILDDIKNKKQSVINAEVEETLGNQQEQLDNKYNKNEVYTKSETYSKSELNSMITTPEQHYVTVDTYADLANISSPSDDTIYRVSSYNGNTSQVDNTVYSEYAYDGTNFVFLCVKSQIDEVYDISAHHSNNTYVDLAAALDGGNNIPQELRRGGMSVKFVQSSDNKYVQYRLMATTWSTTVTDWQGVDETPTVGSYNLVESGGVYDELYDAQYVAQKFIGSPIENSYIASNGALGPSSQYHINYYPCQKGDKFRLFYSSFAGTFAISYGVYSTDDTSEIGAPTKLAVGPVGNTTDVFDIEITDDAAQLLAVTVYRTDSNMTLLKTSYVNKISQLSANIESLFDEVALEMLKTREWSINGNVSYDSNGIPTSCNITWADGTNGTLTYSNFNDDVFEYTTLTATYEDKTIVYTLTYDSNGYITNETFNIQ